MEYVVFIFFIVMFGAFIISFNFPDIIRVSIGSGLASVLFAMILFSVFEEKYYKQGQIDALNGKVKYELKRNADQTYTWEAKKDSIK